MPSIETDRARSTRVAAILAFAVAGVCGGAAALIAASSTAIASIVCVFGGIAMGRMIGRSWRLHRLPSRHKARTLVLAGTSVMVVLFYAGVHELPVTGRALFSLGTGEFIFGLVSLAVLAVADNSVRNQLADPFCKSCENWVRTVFLWSANAPRAQGSDELKAHLLAHHLEYLEQMRPDGSDHWSVGSYTFHLSRCPCHAWHNLQVAWVRSDEDSQTEIAIVRSLPITVGEAERVMTMNPNPPGESQRDPFLNAAAFFHRPDGFLGWGLAELFLFCVGIVVACIWTNANA
jgi:hypothetical protein